MLAQLEIQYLRRILSQKGSLSAFQFYIVKRIYECRGISVPWYWGNV